MYYFSPVTPRRKRSRPWISMTIYSLIGLLTAGLGILIGLSSNHVIYKSSPHVVAQRVLVDSQNEYYISVRGSDTLYYLLGASVTPTIPSSALADGAEMDIISDPMQSQSIDVTSTDGVHLKGLAYDVVALTLYPSHLTYTTDAYRQHPNGYSENYWPVSAVFLVPGLIVLLLGILIPRRLTIFFRWILLLAGVGFAIGLVLGGAVDVHEFSWHAIESAVAPILGGGLLIALLGGAIGVPVGIIQAIRYNDASNELMNDIGQIGSLSSE